ncbi:MAG: ATP-binding cassette domain-containing protein [Candidatus Aminicenantes bacterium]|nr:ATP-binding cassette domain-containing protein [Candidatus Aminicenantes bacterium]
MLEVQRLAKRLGRVQALRDVSFKTRRGTITAMLGENGAGKTTSLKIALGFLRPDSGAVSVGPGIVGYVPDRPAFLPGLDGWTILGLSRVRGGGREASGNGRGFGAAVLAAARSLLFDPSLLRRRPASYSAGNAKKFAYLQNLVLAPDLLVADEPYAGLDPPSIKRVRDLFCGLRQAGKTVLLSSHMLAEMERIADSFIVLSQGRTVAHAGLREWRLLRSGRTGPDIESVFLRLAGP